MKSNTQLFRNSAKLLLCVVRLIISLPLIVIITIVYLPVMTLLGVKYSGDASIKLFGNFVFNHQD
jgi:hypothetical protein